MPPHPALVVLSRLPDPVCKPQDVVPQPTIRPRVTERADPFDRDAKHEHATGHLRQHREDRTGTTAAQPLKARLPQDALPGGCAPATRRPGRRAPSVWPGDLAPGPVNGTRREPRRAGPEPPPSAPGRCKGVPGAHQRPALPRRRKGGRARHGHASGSPCIRLRLMTPDAGPVAITIENGVLTITLPVESIRALGGTASGRSLRRPLGGIAAWGGIDGGSSSA